MRRYDAPFESDLREHARAMGLEHRWSQIEEVYAEVNLLFGDILKVTPTSKVVGDMALFKGEVGFPRTAHRALYEDVSVVPTPVFFNGVREGEETGMAIEPGARVKKGDPLLSLEAMKMQTVLEAHCDAVVKAVYVKPNDVVSTKDLLVEFE